MKDVLEEWNLKIEANGLEGCSVRRRRSSLIGFDADSNVPCGFEEGPKKAVVDAGLGLVPMALTH